MNDDQSLEIKALQAEIEDLKSQLDEVSKQVLDADPEITKYKELAARSQADLQNAKERLQREAEDLRKFAVEGFVVGLLPTLDNLSRAFSHVPQDLQDSECIGGFKAIEKALVSQLSSSGLEKIESLGQQADPEKHEVLQVGEGQEGEIIEVFEDGYTLHGKVIRSAKVKVGGA